MKIGLDYFNVISQFPEVLQHLAEDWMASGHEVYIVSAVGHRRLEKSGGLENYKQEIRDYNIPNVETVIVVFDNEEEIPQRKLDVCKKHDINIFIDDRPETVKLLHENGIVALLMPKPIKILLPKTKVED